MKYTKKKFKQHNNELASKKIEIENLKNQLNEIKSWQSNKDSWHLYDLDLLQKWHEIIVCGRFADSKLEIKKFNRKKKKETTDLGVRKYSTSSRNTYLKEISKGGFYVYSTNASIRTASTIYSSPFSTFASIKASSDSAFENKTSYVSNSLLNNALNIKTENNLTFGFLNTIEDLINNLKNDEKY